MNFEHLVAELDELGRPGDVDVLGAAHRDRLEVLVAHHRAEAQPAGARAALLDGGEEDPVLAGQADRRHLGIRLLELLADQFRRLPAPLPAQMRGVAQLDLVVVDPEVDQLGRLAAEDDLVVAGMLQLGAKEAAHHRVGHQPGLRRDGGDDGAVGARRRRAAKQPGAENQQVVRRERSGLWRHPIPQHPGVRAQAAEDTALSRWIGRYPLDVPAGQVDFQVETCFGIPHIRM